MMRKAQASDTMSRVRATEQFLSRRAVPALPLVAAFDVDLADGVALGVLAVAGRGIPVRVSLRRVRIEGPVGWQRTATP